MATSEFINECKNYANCNRYGKLEFSSPALELNQSNKIQEFTIDSGCYDNGNIIGSVYVTKFNTQLINALDDTVENREFDASVGVTYTTTEEVEGEEVETDTTEYIGMGTYVVEKPKDEQTTNFSSFVAYDLLMQHLEDKYVSNLDYENDTITISDVYDELCTNLGLTPVTTTFTNSTITVENNPFGNGETNRTVLQSIAKVACAFVYIDDDTNEIDLKWLSDSLDYTFQPNDYSSLEGGKVVYGPVNSLIIKNSTVDSENVSYSDDESIALNGEHQLAISEDYFLYNATKRQEALTAIWNKVNGLTYTECTLTTYTGKPFLKKGSKIRVYLDNENYIDSYVLQNEFKYNGAFSNVIKAPVLTEQELITKQDVSLGEALRNTQIIVNKQDGTITSLTKRTQALENDNIDIKTNFGNYTLQSDFVDLQTQVIETQTDTYKKTEVQQILKGTFYDENNNRIVSEIVKTTSGTFDENGMTYEKTNAQTKTTINEVGVNTRRTSNNESILFAGYVDDNNTEYADFKGQTIVASENMQVKNYFVMPTAHSRIEKYENGGGMFYV
jgi:hypothetical protein